MVYYYAAYINYFGNKIILRPINKIINKENEAYMQLFRNYKVSIKPLISGLIFCYDIFFEKVIFLFSFPGDYRELQGEWIPFKKLGYPTLEKLFLDVPGFKVSQVNGEWYVDAIASEDTQHIAAMVSRQKSNKKPTPRFNHTVRIHLLTHKNTVFCIKLQCLINFFYRVDSLQNRALGGNLQLLTLTLIPVTTM